MIEKKKDKVHKHFANDDPTEFDPEKTKDYQSDKCFKIFKATVFSIRNDALPKATPGWVITDVEDIGWIGEVFNQETELF